MPKVNISYLNLAKIEWIMSKRPLYNQLYLLHNLCPMLDVPVPPYSIIIIFVKRLTEQQQLYLLNPLLTYPVLVIVFFKFVMFLAAATLYFEMCVWNILVKTWFYLLLFKIDAWNFHGLNMFTFFIFSLSFIKICRLNGVLDRFLSFHDFLDSYSRFAYWLGC